MTQSSVFSIDFTCAQHLTTWHIAETLKWMGGAERTPDRKKDKQAGRILEPVPKDAATNVVSLKI